MLNPKPIIILTTAYDEFALKAFELEVKDYLLKPFSFERFYKPVLRLYQEYSSRNAGKNEFIEAKKEQDYIFIKEGHRIRKLALREILYVEGMKDYLQIQTINDKILTLMNFNKMEELLPQPGFARVHRSFMVAIDKINHIEKNRIRIGDKIIPISETYAEGFHNIIRDFQ